MTSSDKLNALAALSNFDGSVDRLIWLSPSSGAFSWKLSACMCWNSISVCQIRSPRIQDKWPIPSQSSYRRRPILLLRGLRRPKSMNRGGRRLAFGRLQSGLNLPTSGSARACAGLRPSMVYPMKQWQMTCLTVWENASSHNVTTPTTKPLPKNRCQMSRARRYSVQTHVSIGLSLRQQRAR